MYFFHFSGNIPFCLTFDYHMYGANMGTLRVDYSNNNQPYAGEWSRAGNQGNQWNSASVNIPVGGFSSKVIIESAIK